MQDLKASERQPSRSLSLGWYRICTFRRESHAQTSGVDQETSSVRVEKVFLDGCCRELLGGTFSGAPDKAGDHLFLMVCAPLSPSLFLLPHVKSEPWSGCVWRSWVAVGDGVGGCYQSRALEQIA